jgi:stage II sporulation protein AB (anti-sigma F factor)
MEIKNEMRLMFLSKSSNESFARVTAAAFIAQLDPIVSELVDIKTAVSEAVSNSIIHGYEEKFGIITLEMRISENNLVEVFVEDQGKGILDIKKAREPMFTTKKNEDRAGMGFTVMETFMDSVEVISEPNSGTKVIMKKQLTANIHNDK